ncbi:MAG: PAS domain S-box protein [Nitrospinae bacterium]|nr:PAS domain S-box protein [Nitrospinota bacterium]
MAVSAQSLLSRSDRAPEPDGLYRAAFNASGVVKLLADPADARIVDVNQAACDYYGYPREELVGLPISHFSETPHDELLSLMALALGQTRNRFETRHRLASGDLREVEINVHPAYHDGRLLLAAVIFDITAAKRLERDLASAVRRLETALGAGQVGVWELDVATNSVWRTPSHDLLYGYSTPLPDWSFERFLSHVLPEERETIGRLYREAIIDGKAVTFQTRIRRADGELRWIEVDATPLQGAGGAVTAISGSVRDVTRIKENEAALENARQETEKASRFKDRFLSVVAHDLRNPLSGMLGLLRLLAGQRDRDEATKLNMIAAAIRAGERAQALMEDLLSVSRFKTGAIKVRMRPVPLRRLTGRVLDSYQEVAGVKGIALENRLPDTSMVVGDETLVEVILQNLVGNAIKFGRAGGRIAVSLAPGEPGILAVFDSGVGVPEEWLGRLFSYEETTSSVGTAGETGTGMGLPLCRDMMNAMGGDLTVASQEGKGTLFYATFTHGAVRFPQSPPTAA